MLSEQVNPIPNTERLGITKPAKGWGVAWRGEEAVGARELSSNKILQLSHDVYLTSKLGMRAQHGRWHLEKSFYISKCTLTDFINNRFREHVRGMSHLSQALETEEFGLQAVTRSCAFDCRAV